MCASFTKPLKMSNMLGQTLKSFLVFFLFFFSRDASVNQGRLALFINGKMQEEALFVLCLFIPKEWWRFKGQRLHHSFLTLSSVLQQYGLSAKHVAMMTNLQAFLSRFITMLYLRYTFLTSLCCGRQTCWSWLAGRPRQRQLHSEIEENFISRRMHF